MPYKLPLSLSFLSFSLPVALSAFQLKMLKPRWCGLLLLTALVDRGLTNPIAAGYALGNLSSYSSQLVGRDTGDDFDPSDLSFITRMAAIGDSYSAGIGAGARLQGDGGRSQSSLQSWLMHRG